MRRIVMARAQDGTTVLDDTALPAAVRVPGLSGVELTGLWAAGPAPELPIDPHQSAEDVTALPTAGETSFRLIRMDGGSEMAMHATDTVDYLVVLSGEVELVPQGGPAMTLGPGDFAVQLGGSHAWLNRAAAACVLAAVIIGATVRPGESPR